MAGSMKYFRYLTDSGNLYALWGDESNIELVHVVNPQVTVANEDDTPYVLPRNVKPRYATYKSTTTPHVRKVPIMSASAFAEMKVKNFSTCRKTFNENVEGEVLTFQLVRLTPEKMRGVTSVDTGLNGGDNP